MDIFRYTVIVTILFVGLSFSLTEVDAQIQFDEDGRWGTTFDYDPCSLGGAGGETRCQDVETDGIDYARTGGSSSDADPYTHVTPDANHPGGLGGNGLRQWKMSGNDNNNTWGVIASFPGTEPEVWIRWYHRYEAGFEWKNGIGAGTKEMYPYSEYNGEPYVGYGYGGKYRIALQSAGNKAYYADKGWNDDYPGGVSDGLWHCYEVYFKAETDKNNPDGILRIWRDGELIGEWFDANIYNNEPGQPQNGMNRILFPSNQKDPGLERAYYLDMDDVAIYNRTPPNTDAHGNSFIGPIGGGGGSPSPIMSPAPPISVTIMPPTGIAVY